MAGLLKTIARQLLGSKAGTVSATRTSKPAYDSTVQVRHVAPVVGPQIHVSYASESVTDKSSPKKDTSEKKDKPLKDTLEKKNIEKGTVSEDDENILVVLSNSSEGNKEVGKDDYLLNQIDEFREKAQQLQDLLLSKESKVVELQHIVDEREGKAKELEAIVKERQRKADGIAEEMAKEVTAEITSQIDAIIGKVTAKLDEFGITIGNELKDGQTLTEQQYAEIKAALNETLPALNTQLEALKTDLSEKVHSENVKCYRNVSDLIKTVEDKMDLLKNAEQSIEQKAGAVHKCTIALIVLTVINMLGIAAAVLLQLSNVKLF